MFNKISYKCFIINFFFMSFLVGCGGGGGNSAPSNLPSSLSASSTSSNLPISSPSSSSASSNLPTSSSSSSNTSSSTSNTAPTLTGVLNFEAKAGNTSTLVINAADKENDKLQITIANKPDWLSAELNNDQVTITANPSFFDIKDYSFVLRISDGKLSREYPLSISVIDNNAKWVTANVAVGDLIGSWEIDDGSRLYIYPNGLGSYITSDDKLNLLKWSGSGSDDISIVIPDNACRECTTPFPILSVAKKPGYLRLLINNGSIAVNAKKLSFTPPADGNYLSLYNYPSWGVYSQLSSDGKDLLFKAGVEANFTQGNNTPAYLIYALNFSAHINQSNTASATFDVTDVTTSSISISFKNIKTNIKDMITFKQQIISVELVPSAAKDLIAHVKSKLVLTGSSENINIDDYEPILAIYLSQEQEIYHESILSTVTTPPTISAGDKYYLPNASGRWNNITYSTPDSRSTATTLVFETSSKGYVLLEGALFTSPQKTPFAWSTANNTLILTFENGLAAIDYTFVLEKGSLFALNKQAQTYAPAVKATNFSGQFSTGFYFGKVALRTEYWIYQYMYLADVLQKGVQLVTITSKSESSIYHYKIEDDNSVTFLIDTNCHLGDFSLCEDSQKTKVTNNETGASLEYVNFKLIAQHDDLYTFLQTRYVIKNTGNSITQSIVHLTYDEFGMQH